MKTEKIQQLRDNFILKMNAFGVECIVSSENSAVINDKTTGLQIGFRFDMADSVFHYYNGDEEMVKKIFAIMNEYHELMRKK